MGIETDSAVLAPGQGITSAERSLGLSLLPAEVVKRLKRTGATLCGTRLRLVDAAAAVNNLEPASSSCR